MSSDVAGGVPRKVCDDCQIYQWTRDNSHIVITEQGDRVMSRVNLATGARLPVIVGSAYIDRPLLSPNERWLVFNTDFTTDRRVLVAPLHDDRATPESEWTTIHSSGAAERSAGLSPDGRLLYLLLESDGFRCLYAMRLDPETGRRAGRTVSRASLPRGVSILGLDRLWNRNRDRDVSRRPVSRRPATSG